MGDPLFPSNRKMARDIAMAVSFLIALQGIGILSMVGLNLNAFNLFGVTASFILTVIGSAWVGYGLYKNQF